MKEFLNYLSKLKNYKSSVVLYLICYLFTAIFTVVSIPAIIPLFEMLFFQATNAVEKPQEINSVMTFIQSLKYQFSVWVNGMPKKDALTIICLLICGIFFLKNLFRYSAIYIVAPIKAGLIRDTRSELFRKFVNLPLAWQYCFYDIHQFAPDTFCLSSVVYYSFCDWRNIQIIEEECSAGTGGIWGVDFSTRRKSWWNSDNQSIWK